MYAETIHVSINDSHYNTFFIVKMQTQPGNKKDEKSTKSTGNSTILSSLKNSFIGMFAAKEKSNYSAVMSVEQIGELENMKAHEIITILKEFINHFSNFGVQIADSIDIITSFSNKFNICQNKISCLLSYLNSSSFTIKKVNNQEIKNIIPKKSNTDLYLEKVIFFQNEKEGINLLLLNKSTNQKLRKKYFKNILRSKELDTSTRKKIWMLILKTVSIIYKNVIGGNQKIMQLSTHN